LPEIYILDLMGIILIIGSFVGGTLSFRKKVEDSYLFWLAIIISVSCLVDSVVATFTGQETIFARYVVLLGMSWLYFSIFLIGPLWVIFIEKHVNILNSKLIQSFINYISLLGIIGIVINLFKPIIFIVDEQAVYHRSQFYWLYIFFSFFFLLLGVYVYLVRGNKFGMINIFPVGQFMIPLLVGIIIENFFSGISVVWAGCAVSAALMIITLQNENLCIDKLTGLFNRYYLDKYNQVLGTKGAYCFMMVDINGFKQINDLFGHSEGDTALILVSKCLKDVIGEKGSVIRYAGDEFVVLLNTSDVQIADKYVKDITDSINAIGDQHNKGYNLSLSIGYEIFDMIHIHMDEIMEVIDKKMFIEKKNYYKTHDRRIVDNKL